MGQDNHLLFHLFVALYLLLLRPIHCMLLLLLRISAINWTRSWLISKPPGVGAGDPLIVYDLPRAAAAVNWPLIQLLMADWKHILCGERLFMKAALPVVVEHLSDLVVAGSM